MRRPMWLNQPFAFGVTLGLLVGVGATVAWFMLRSPAVPPITREQLDDPGNRAVIVAYFDSDRKSGAHRRARSLAQAIESYQACVANPDGVLPRSPKDLVQPPFGGASFLRNGPSDLIDPWGNPYEMEHLKKPDGEPFILIKTTAPDGTLITQFGIGDHAIPKP